MEAICSYGCERKAVVRFKNRKYGCSKDINSCPAKRSDASKKLKKIAKKQKRRFKRIQEYDKNPKRCKKCNKPIAYDRKVQGNKFCSQNCAAIFNNTGRKHKEETRRKISRTTCLNIANSRNNLYKTGKHTTWFGQEIKYRSSYEKRILDVLDKIKEVYVYEKLRIRYVFNSEERIYMPDFFIPRLNLIIESKSEWSQQVDKDKIESQKAATIEEGYRIIIIGDKEIKEFESHKDIDKLLKASVI